MAHITLPEGLPGIRGPMAFRPETARPLNELVDVLLWGPHTLARGERELIAAAVSAANDCEYCQTIHGAIAAHHLGGDEALVDYVKSDHEDAPISDKLRALITIARKTALGGLHVTADDVARARTHGATDSRNSRHRARLPRCSVSATAMWTALPPGLQGIRSSTANVPQ